MTDILPQVRKKRKAIDEKLLRNARKSMTWLAKETGLEATEVAERMSILLEDVGWMSERQEERYLLIELGEVISDARKRLTSASDEDYAGIAKIVLGGMQQMADRWDKRKKLVEEDIEAITRANARTFGEAYSVAADAILHSLKQLYADIEVGEADWYFIKRQALERADRTLEAKVKE